jgi:hypothetical protein
MNFEEVEQQITGVNIEDWQIETWCFERLRDLGLKPREASELACAGVDWHAAERLILRGCPPQLAAKILR